MSVIREDDILPMIKMMGEVIAAARNLKNFGQFLEADQSLRKVLLEIMPEHADLIEMVDENTAISFPGNYDLVEAYMWI